MHSKAQVEFMRPDEYAEIFALVNGALRTYRKRMDAHQELRKQINLIHADLTMRGIHSPAIESATYSIETLAKAYMESQTIIDWRGLYNFTKAEARIAQILYLCMGRTVNADTILQSIYADRIDDYHNLIDSKKVMQVLICRMRKILKSSPFSIVTDHGIGYRMTFTPSAQALTALQELQAH